MIANARIPIICAALVYAATILWLAVANRPILMNAGPFLLLLGAWFLLILIKKFPNGRPKLR